MIESHLILQKKTDNGDSKIPLDPKSTPTSKFNRIHQVSKLTPNWFNVVFGSQ